MTPKSLRSSAMLVALSALVAACTAVPGSDAHKETPTTSAAEMVSALERVPEEARSAAGEGEPRSAGYWIIWSSCGENNRAETAAANGGREAGWIIMDDLLAMPGVSVGEHPVATCDDGVAILEVSGDDPVGGLARQLLTAELNLNSGSEHCRAVDETVAVAQALLASYGFVGSDAPVSIDAEAVASIDQVADLLAAYNSGELCR